MKNIGNENENNMLQLQNIDKLIGTSILNWECVNVSDAMGSYLITFKPRGNSIFTAEFLLNRDDSRLGGIYRVDGILYESTGFGNVNIGNLDMHVTRAQLQTPMEFVRVLTRPLMVFDKDMEINIQRKMFNTSSLASNKFVGRGAPTSPFGKTNLMPPHIQNMPKWYVGEPQLKPPTMWETFKEMVKWDKWINIVFPMRTVIKDILPTKKLKAKKAAY
jgi:hypothetical protein